MFVEHKEQGEAAPAKVGKMKLSEAIRIGAQYRPQGRRFYFYQGASCAIGAAWEGVYGKVNEQREIVGGSHLLSRLGVPRSMHDEITKRNDDLHWTREQIADWLESQGY